MYYDDDDDDDYWEFHFHLIANVRHRQCCIIYCFCQCSLRVSFHDAMYLWQSAKALKSVEAALLLFPASKMSIIFTGCCDVVPWPFFFGSIILRRRRLTIQVCSFMSTSAAFLTISFCHKKENNCLRRKQRCDEHLSTSMCVCLHVFRWLLNPFELSKIDGLSTDVISWEWKWDCVKLFRVTFLSRWMSWLVLDAPVSHSLCEERAVLFYFW